MYQLIVILRTLLQDITKNWSSKKCCSGRVHHFCVKGKRCGRDLSNGCGDVFDLNQETGEILIAPAFSTISFEGNICCIIGWYSSLEKLLKVTCFVERIVWNLKERVGRGECLEKNLMVAKLNEAKQENHAWPK